MVFIALLATTGFLSYQVYDRDEAIHNLQMRAATAEIILGMCKKTNQGLKEKMQNQPAKQVRSVAHYVLEEL